MSLAVFVGISGPTRAGKSTLANGVMRYLLADKIRHCSREQTRRGCYRVMPKEGGGISYVNQDGFFLVDKIFGELKGNWENPAAIDHEALLDYVRGELANRDVDFVVAEGFLLFHDVALFSLLDVGVWIAAEREVVRERRMRTKRVPEDYFDQWLWPCHMDYQERVFRRTVAVGKVVQIDGAAAKETILHRTLAVLPAKGGGTGFFLPKGRPEHANGVRGLWIQIASGLHLEAYKDLEGVLPHLLTPSAPVLALLGDICLFDADETRAQAAKERLEFFLKRQARRFDLVLVLEPANAECQACSSARAVCDRVPGIRWLDRTSLLLEGVRVLGTALGVEFHGAVEQATEVVPVTAGEKTGGRSATASPSNRKGAEDVGWLQTEVSSAAARGEVCLVLTQQPPVFEDAVPRHRDSDGGSRGAFPTDARDLFNKSVHTWVCGRARRDGDSVPSQVLLDTRVVCNWRGTSPQVGYRSDFVVHVPLASRVEPVSGCANPADVSLLGPASSHNGGQPIGDFLTQPYSGL